MAQGNPEQLARFPDSAPTQDNARADDQSLPAGLASAMKPAPAEAVAALAAPPASSSVVRSIGFKQTLIPILLTLGIMLPTIASLRFLCGQECIFAFIPEVWNTALGLAGLLLLAAGILMILQIKRDLSAK